MRKVGKVLICLSVCVLGAACARTENIETIEESSVMVPASMPMSEIIAQEYAITQEETDSKENEEPVTIISSVEAESVNEQSEHQDNIDMKMEIGVSDILIPEIPYLAETPFMVADIEHVLVYDSELEKSDGYEGANGHYNYWTGEGIEYVTHSSQKNLAGIVINNSDYSLANGIRVGMTELELIQTGYPFEKCKSEIDNGIGMIIFGSGLLRDKKGPLNMTDYDYIYAYVGSASADEIKNYGIDRTSCYSIVLLMKDDVIDEVILDLPTAG